MLKSFLMLLTAAVLSSTEVYRPGEIHWQQTNTDGSKYTVLEGDRATAGKPFSYAFFLPDGKWVGPHFHSADARVFVSRGTLLLGTGKYEKSKAVAIEQGEYFMVPANETHWEGARGDTLIIGTATGPWTTTNVPTTNVP